MGRRDLQLLPSGVQGKGPHEPAEWWAMLHTLQHLLQLPPCLAHRPAALGQALCRQLSHGTGRGDEAIELTEAMARLPNLLLELRGEALEAGGQGAVGHVQLLDEAAGPGQSLGVQHLRGR